MSEEYIVRKLEYKDIDEIYFLCKENKRFYEFCPPMVSIESIKDDMIILPKGKTLKDKYYEGFYKGDKLVAIIDLITNYPDEETCFIGFFMVDINVQNKGIGSYIINAVCDELKRNNYKNVRLAWIEDDKKTEYFWHKNGFKDLEKKLDQNSHNVIEAIRVLI